MESRLTDLLESLGSRTCNYTYSFKHGDGKGIRYYMVVIHKSEMDTFIQVFYRYEPVDYTVVPHTISLEIFVAKIYRYGKVKYSVDIIVRHPQYKIYMCEYDDRKYNLFLDKLINFILSTTR